MGFQSLYGALALALSLKVIFKWYQLEPPTNNCVLYTYYSLFTKGNVMLCGNVNMSLPIYFLSRMEGKYVATWKGILSEYWVHLYYWELCPYLPDEPGSLLSSNQDSMSLPDISSLDLHLKTRMNTVRIPWRSSCFTIFVSSMSFIHRWSSGRQNSKFPIDGVFQLQRLSNFYKDIFSTIFPFPRLQNNYYSN